MKDFESYLRQEMQDGKIDFQIRSTAESDGRVTFYIHPEGKSGDTEDYEVAGNVLSPNKDITISGA